MVAKGPTIVLGFDPSKRNDPPHSHRKLASKTVRGTTFAIVSNWPRTAWWLTANKSGLRMATGLRTTSATKAAEWERALRAGEVALDLWFQ